MLLYSFSNCMPWTFITFNATQSWEYQYNINSRCVDFVDHFLQFIQILLLSFSNHILWLYFIVQVVLDACTTQSIVEHRSLSNHYLLNTISDASAPSPPTSALLHNVRVLGQVVLSWRVWQRAAPGVWEMLLRAIASLVGPYHPHRTFNIKQLHAVGMVEGLLRTCNVSYYNGGMGAYFGGLLLLWCYWNRKKVSVCPNNGITISSIRLVGSGWNIISTSVSITWELLIMGDNCIWLVACIIHSIQRTYHK